MWSWFLLHLCKMMVSPVVFFIFPKFWFFRLSEGGKRAKTVLNDKKFYLLHSISEKPYIMWLSFMVNICKMIISSSVFFIFSKFWFSGFIGYPPKGQKTVHNDKKFCLSHSISQEPYITWLWFFGAHV